MTYTLHITIPVTVDAENPEADLIALHDAGRITDELNKMLKAKMNLPQGAVLTRITEGGRIVDPNLKQAADERAKNYNGNTHTK